MFLNVSVNYVFQSKSHFKCIQLGKTHYWSRFHSTFFCEVKTILFLLNLSFLTLNFCISNFLERQECILMGNVLLWEALEGMLKRRQNGAAFRMKNAHLIYGDLGEMLKLKSLGAVGSGQSHSFIPLRAPALLWIYWISSPLFPDFGTSREVSLYLSGFLTCCSPHSYLLLSLLPVGPYSSPHSSQLPQSLLGALCHPQGLLRAHLLYFFFTFLLSGPHYSLYYYAT